MDKEKQSISSSIIEISSKDKVTKEATMLVHKIEYANGNGLDFKQEYVEKYKDTMLNKPVVARYYPLDDDLGDHEPIFDSNGKIIRLETIAIGTIKDVWIDELKIDDETSVGALYAKADLWNYKYPEIIECLEKLFNDGNAESSVEVEIYSYGDNPTPEYRYPTDYCYIGNCLLGSTVLPADSNAGVISLSQKEIASAVKNDLDNLEKKGEIDMPETKEVFNKGKEVNYHGALEVSSLKFSEVGNQIYNLLNPVDAQNGGRDYNFWIRDLYTDYVIAESWDNYEELWKISYTIENDTVTLAAKDQWQKGKLGFIPEGIEVNSLMSEKETEINELNDKLQKAKEELSAMSEENKDKVQELEATIQELNSKIEELNSTIVTQEEAKSTLEGQITELNSKVEELTPFKENFEKAEKEKQVTELSSKYSKLLSDETFKSERVQNALKELDAVELNSVVVEEIAKQKVTEVETASKNDDVTVVASKQEDLVSKDKHEFWAAPRS
ncbi:hypothetical protein [Bacillus infantis]|uniref:hypothetical protein n=1 Tax=Bacillus infantis TaxID=324767 RepID=UPI003CFA3F77